MSQAVAEPVAGEWAIHRLAEQLLETTPRTPDHWNAWAAYRLGIAISAEIENGQRQTPVTESDLSAAYLVNLSEAARHIGAAVMIPPLNWSMRDWQHDSRILCSAVQTGGRDIQDATWSDVLEGLASGSFAMRDRRASSERFLRYVAFRRLD